MANLQLFQEVIDKLESGKVTGNQQHWMAMSFQKYGNEFTYERQRYHSTMGELLDMAAEDTEIVGCIAAIGLAIAFPNWIAEGWELKNNRLEFAPVGSLEEIGKVFDLDASEIERLIYPYKWQMDWWLLHEHREDKTEVLIIICQRIIETNGVEFLRHPVN